MGENQTQSGTPSTSTMKMGSCCLVDDPIPLDLFYATPTTNVNSLWQSPTRIGEIEMHMPRMLFLPLPFVPFFVGKHRTPFALHQFIKQMATSANYPITVAAPVGLVPCGITGKGGHKSPQHWLARAGLVSGPRIPGVVQASPCKHVGPG